MAAIEPVQIVSKFGAAGVVPAAAKEFAHSMRVLVIEDDAQTAAYMVKGLTESGHTVDHANNGRDGLFHATSGDYDVMVVDRMLPGLDGLAVIQAARAANVSTPILILSALSQVDERVAGLKAGADDYLTKPFAFSELLARVQALLRRASGVAEPTRLTVGDLSLDLLTRQVGRGAAKIDLKPREFALLEYLMRNANRVVSKTMIMEHVWDYNFDPHTNVVEACVCRLRDKVDKGFAEAKLIHTIRGMGYVIRQAS
jgi:two-component system, OmpR family, response regulator